MITRRRRDEHSRIVREQGASGGFLDGCQVALEAKDERRHRRALIDEVEGDPVRAEQVFFVPRQQGRLH